MVAFGRRRSISAVVVVVVLLVVVSDRRRLPADLLWALVLAEILRVVAAAVVLRWLQLH